jgi:signal transduction histidine kinase
MSTGSEGRPLGASLRTAGCILASTVCYYVATQIAWTLTFPDSKVSLFFPPHALLLCVLLLVPTRHWWAYVLAAVSAHFVATQQAGWPLLYALNCEAYDALKCVLAAAGIRSFIKSPLKALTLRDAVLFILIAVVGVPFGTALWGASFTVSFGFGTRYWIEWRNLGISNAVTVVVLVPAVLLGARYLFDRRPRAVSPGRMLEAAVLGASTVALGMFVFDQTSAGPNASPALLYTPIPLLIWSALRFGLGGISASMLLITSQAIWGTMRGHGPFLQQTPTENALALQLFLLVTAAPLMLLAVVIEAERRAEGSAAQQRAELEHLARVATLGELTATVTHELRQPLAAILANAQVCVRSLDAPVPDLALVRSALDDICEVTDRTDNVLDGMRTMLRRGSVTAPLANVDVNHVIRKVERIARGDATLHHVTVQLGLSSEVPPVKGDSVQLQQVILNLMLNAFSAMSGTGPDDERRLVVRTRSIEKSNVLIEVRDTGTGIAAEQIETIFDSFITSKPEGLGLGLSICRSIVERHGGMISAANNADGGATFSITLPSAAS